MPADYENLVVTRSRAHQQQILSEYGDTPHNDLVVVEGEPLYAIRVNGVWDLTDEHHYPKWWDTEVRCRIIPRRL